VSDAGATDYPVVGNRCINVAMSWDAEHVALLKKLWASGHSAAQIASRLGHSRNAVCAKLLRMGLKRGRKPPTAKPTIVSVSKRRPALLAACARPARKVVSRKPAVRQPEELTKRQLYAMLAEAVRNTGKSRRAI
jgi:GcrA cell cycle regulator